MIEQLTDLHQANGRTVKAALDIGDEYVLVFTDGTMLTVQLMEYEGMSMGRECHCLGIGTFDPLSAGGWRKDFIEAGICTAEELDALREQRDREKRETREQEERMTYERLKRQFEGEA